MKEIYPDVFVVFLSHTIFFWLSLKILSGRFYFLEDCSNYFLAMEHWFNIFMIFFSTFTILFHMLGFCLLISLRNTLGMNKNQRLYLVNLSVSQMIFLGSMIIFRMLHLVHYKDIAHYFVIIHLTVGTISYYLIMIFLTIHRFFELYLNLKYPLYWCDRYTRILLAVTWALLTLPTSVLLAIGNFKQVYKFCHLYIYLTLDATFIFVSVLTYGYIISKLLATETNVYSVTFQRNKARLKKRGSRIRRRLSTKSSAFYLLGLLVFTFIAFILTPNIQECLVVYGLLDKSQKIVYNILYVCGSLSDAVLYIFLSPEVRRLLLRKLKTLFCC